eukprot:gene12659-6559_t
MNSAVYSLSQTASSKWREGLALKGIDNKMNHQSGIKFNSLKKEDRLADSNCLAALGGTQERLQYMALGTGRKKNNQVNILSIDMNAEHHVVQKFDIPGPANNISWIDDKMLIASNNGEVYLKRFQMKDVKDDSKLQRTITYEHLDLKNLDEETPSPEQRLQDTKINVVSINEKEPSKFLTVENQRLHIWNFESTKKPNQTIKGSKEPILCGQWSPHSKYQLMMSGTSKNIKAIDTRNLKTKNGNWVIWQIQNAHQGSIRDIQYHPLVPYWVATAGSDGYIKVWDLRYSGKESLVSISAHDRIIRKINWSKTHADLLASGGIDHKVKIWSLRSDPHYLLEVDDQTHQDIVVGVEFSRNGKIHCHSLSGSGDFGTAVFRPQFLEPLVVSRFGEKDVDEQFVEKKIFTREFPTAFEKIIHMTEKYKKEQELEKGLRLLSLCKPMELSTSRISANHRIRFKKEIKDLSYFIPPNLETNKNIKFIDDQINRVTNLMLNCQILKNIQRNSFIEIYGMEKEIISRIQGNIECIEITTIKEIIKLYLQNDYKKGMNIVIDIGKIFFEKDSYKEFQEIFQIILNPTVYEVTKNPTLSESAYKNFNKRLENPNDIFEQIELQRDVISSLWETDSANLIIKIIEPKYSNDILSIISMPVLRIYLNALLTLGHIEKFFIISSDLIQKKEGYDIAFIIKDLSEKVGVAKFKSKCSMVADTDLEDSLEEKEILAHLISSNEIVIICINISLNTLYIPEELIKEIKTRLENFNKDLTYAFKQLSLTTHGKKSALNYSRETLNLILDENVIKVDDDLNEKILSIRELSENLISNFKQYVQDNKD